METGKILLADILETLEDISSPDGSAISQGLQLAELGNRLNSHIETLSRVSDLPDVSVYVTDYYTGDILMVNKLYAQTRGKSAEELIGTKCWQVFGFDDFCPYCPRDKLLDGDGHHSGPYMWENYLPGYDKWLRITSEVIPWVDGRPAHMASYVDVTEAHQAQEKLARLAFYDADMLLPNLFKLRHDLDEQSDGQSGLLICFDIVALHKINDAYGRDNGSLLLRLIVDWASRLEEDIKLYRVGGDEFGILMAGSNHADAIVLAKKLAARFLQAWKLPLGPDMAVDIFCGATIGIIDLSKFLGKGVDLQGLIERTLDVASRTGEIATYDENIDFEFRSRTLLEMSLRDCVRGDMQGFEVHYQPIIDPASGVWVSLEALCRWTSPEFGPVSPLDFIPIAEQNGLIGTIGLWVLDAAVSQCKRWGLDEHRKFRLNVNLSPLQLLDGSFCENATAILSKYSFPSESLCFEITESTGLSFGAQTLEPIDRLSKTGVRLALDDFGTGYSSFNRLKDIPVDILKIERAFVIDIETDDYLRHLLRSMADLAHSVGMRIIVEGVENIRQVEILRETGADFLQGYLFSRPLPASKLERHLSAFYRPAWISGNNPDGNIAVTQPLENKDSHESANLGMSIIFDNMDIPLYVSDIEAGDLLFANTAAREMHSEEPIPDASKCWEIIRRRSEPCEDCKATGLLDDPDAEKYIWESYDSSANRHYRMYDGIIPWPGGKKAHLHYVVDITAMKKYQNKLEYVASIDSLTRTLNRGSLMLGLSEMLRLANEKNTCVIICFIDIDRLKLTNDTHGHAAGDALILHAVEELQNSVRRDDVIGRYGGDEFVVALYNCPASVAERKINSARDRMIEDTCDNPVKHSFSFGIVESSEVPYQDDDAYVEKLLEIADRRMLAYKQEAFGGKHPGRE